MWSSARRLFARGLVCAIVVVLAGGVGPVGAVDWTDVDLGIHEFGHLSDPEEIVARAGPTEVGFEDLDEGVDNGPWSFDVAGDGSIWLLDQFNYRLLEWDPGASDPPAGSVPLPEDEIGIAADLALGPNGTIYLTYVPKSDPENRNRLMVCALTATGEVIWTASTDIEYFNSRLRTGPDGIVYWEGGETHEWTPVTSPDGQPLSLDEQRAASTPFQSFAGGRWFEADEVGEGAAHEWHFTLLDPNDQVVQAWRVTSEDELGGTVDEPGMADGDPIVMLGIARATPEDYLYEYVAIRLPVAGGAPEEISLDPHATWGDVPVTGLRVGPDGALYQLRSDIDTGVTIAKYALGPEASPSPGVSPSEPPVTPLEQTLPPSPTSPVVAAPAPAGTSRSATPWILASLAALVMAGAGAGLLFWRRALRSRSNSSGSP